MRRKPLRICILCHNTILSGNGRHLFYCKKCGRKVIDEKNKLYQKELVKSGYFKRYYNEVIKSN